ncbi:MAG TPA: protein kinase [Bryobacteraceae bacterium]|nr:protein kinase [Bryobacteraceae bacterium]
MTPERFHQVEELYQAARERPAEERAALLAQTDPELRREVESLLAQRPGVEFLDRPAIHNAPPTLEGLTLTRVSAGASLGPFRIESKLGEGGMGEVFRAVDTRLGRPVAIKFAYEQFSARFEREVRAISSLNHPNICTLYDVGPNYLVMELVEGETLAGRLKSGPLPLKTALLYASQIAAALAEAHVKGIIHRDLKPGNIMIAKSGVKVLDFGLAKSGADENVTASHMAIGTPAYMAPEQREGKPADARTDIYSFGCVLYEMLTGGRAGARRRRVPSRKVQRIVNRCLEEDPGRRWQSAAWLDRELAKAAAGATPWKAVATAASIVAVFAAAYAYLQRPPKLTGKDVIVLAGFENKTGDPVFDDTLRQGLAVELQQSPFLSLLPEARIQQTLALMGQSRDARLTSQIAQEICVRTGSAAILEGSIARVGSEYVLGLRARNCNSGSALDQEQIQAARREDVLNSLSQIARKFRTRVGESLATVEKHSTPLAEATTPSLEALQAYSTALKGILHGGTTADIPLFSRAVEIDPQFATAWAHLGFAYSTFGRSVLAVESTTKAWKLRNRVSQPERFFIDFLYERQVTGNLEKAYQTLELWHQTYPREEETPSPRGLLGGISTQGTGRFDRAIEASQRLIAADPGVPIPYGSLASSLFFLDRFPEAGSALQQADERKLAPRDDLVMRYNIAALTGDKDQMDRVVARAKGEQRVEHRVAHAEALALARSGRLRAARLSSSRAVDLVLQEGEEARELAAAYQAARAVWEALCGNAAEGQSAANAALKLASGRDVRYAAGLALALSGDSSRSERVAGDLEKEFPEDTFVKFTYSPVLRALAALGRGKPADAVERLEIARQYELAANGLNFSFYLGGLHSAYVRGEALLATRRYAEAAAEFQKILNHRGIVGLDPIGALAHLQLGRVYAFSGDKGKAKSAYDAFFTLWKDADPGIPVLKQAKAEYAKLQ